MRSERFSGRRRAVLATALIATGALPTSTAAGSDQATPEQVTILSPASGVLSSHPSKHHTPGQGNWAADVRPGGSTVYAQFKNATGTLKLSIIGSYGNCSGKAGTQLTVQVLVDGVNVGWVKYAHLNPVKTSGSIENGAKLGTMFDGTKTIKDKYGNDCWTGKHVHVEPRNANGYSCYRPMSQGASLTTSTALGNLGGRYVTGAKQPCPPPNTAITSAPSSPTRSTSASFRFISSQPLSKFDCRLDGSSWSRCVTPKSYTGIREGAHKFYVRAVSDIGTDSSPATKSWRVDLTPPSAPAIETVGLPAAPFASRVTMTIAYSDAECDVAAWKIGFPQATPPESSWVSITSFNEPMCSAGRGSFRLVFECTSTASGYIQIRDIGLRESDPYSFQFACSAPTPPSLAGCNITYPRSIDGVTPSQITFVNDTTVTVDIWWLDYEGRPVYYASLGSGQSYVQPTWLTHPWVAVDRSGACRGHTVSDALVKTYVIT